MQLPLREAQTKSIQEFNIWEKQAKQISKKNQQLFWKSCNYSIQLKHNTAVGNRQEESLQLQRKHQPIEIKKLKI